MNDADYRFRVDPKPPSIPITCPVTQAFAGSSSHVMQEATSAGSPSRPKACMDWEASADFGFPQILSVIGVRTKPGATALTRIRFEA